MPTLLRGEIRKKSPLPPLLRGGNKEKSPLPPFIKGEIRENPLCPNGERNYHKTFN
ncbi:MAG: hypothetical protein LBQ24_03410 [Candidatus Peribacteria bacterium]|nr:hypothetical protein [Candidatus Peribacteria bacterium]